MAPTPLPLHSLPQTPPTGRSAVPSHTALLSHNTSSQAVFPSKCTRLGIHRAPSTCQAVLDVTEEWQEGGGLPDMGT